MPEFKAPFPYRDDLGEGPCWDPDTSLLWRVAKHNVLCKRYGLAVCIELPVSGS